MNIFTSSFTLGILSFLAYKSSIFELVQRHSSNWFNLNTKYSLELASINLTEAEEHFDKVAKELVSAFHDVGFAYVVDVKDFDADELLKWTKWFFDIPLEQKMKIAKNAFNSESPSVYRGYYPVVPGGHSYKEAFEMGTFERESITRDIPPASDIRNLTTGTDGRFFMRNVLQEKNIYPITDDLESDTKFIEVMRKYYKFYAKTAKQIFHLIAHGLGFEKTQFDHLFEQELSTFRLIHYPTRLYVPETIPAEAWDGGEAIVTGEHFDGVMLTVLATFENDGLQIKPPGFKEWIDVPAVKDRLVINIGALLAHMVEGRMIATNHRVLDIGVDRYSVPVFYEPGHDGDLSKTFFGNRNVFVGNYTWYGPWMTNRTSMFVEYATTDFGIVD